MKPRVETSAAAREYVAQFRTRHPAHVGDLAIAQAYVEDVLNGIRDGYIVLSSPHDGATALERDRYLEFIERAYLFLCDEDV